MIVGVLFSWDVTLHALYWYKLSSGTLSIGESGGVTCVETQRRFHMVNSVTYMNVDFLSILYRFLHNGAYYSMFSCFPFYSIILELFQTYFQTY